MPISYRRDDVHHRIHLTASPPLTVRDVLDAVYRQAAEATWNYGTVVDLRSAILAAEGAGDILEHTRELVDVHGVRGPLAYVVWESSARAQASAYASDARGLVVAVDVFLNIKDAERWLDRQRSLR